MFARIFFELAHFSNQARLSLSLILVTIISCFCICRYQHFLDHLIPIAALQYPNNEAAFIVHDGARPHLNVTVPQQHRHQFNIVTQPPYSPFFNPVEQAHSCFKAAVGRELCNPQVQNQLIDAAGERTQLGLTIEAWKSRILLRIANQAINEVTRQKCANWCRRVERFIHPSLARQDIVHD